MSSLASTSWTVPPPPIPLRVDDDELGQRIALALRTRRPTLDAEPLLAGRYRLEGRVGIDEHVERFDATRVADGRWVTVEMPVDDVRAQPEARERFIRMARQQCRLRHPHVMYALQHGVASDGRPYLVREALDTETLAQMLAREGSVTWTRARSIALQLCSAVTAARELGLAPADLSLDGCRRARHGRSIDDIRLSEWRELEAMTPDERDERGAVFAIARILEELVAGYGPDGQVGTNPHVVPPPPAELGTVLARGRSLVPSARYATVEQLGLAIAAIGDEAVGRAPSPREADTTYAVYTTPRRRSRPIQIDQPAEITCATAAVLVPPASERKVIVTRPPVETRRVLWPWIGLAAMVGVCAVHVVAPKFWPGVVAIGRSGVHALRDVVRGREALDVAATPAVAVSVDEARALAKAEPFVPFERPIPTPIMPASELRSTAVPPAPVAVEPIAPPRPKARPKKTIVAMPGSAVAAVAELAMSQPTQPNPPPNQDPPTDTPPRQEPPSPTPPVQEPPREIDAPPPVQGEMLQ